MANAGSNVTVDTAGTLIYDARVDKGPVQKFFVGCRDSSVNPVLVQVDGLHEDGEFVGIPTNAAIEFMLGHNGIARVFAKGDGGDAEIDFGITGIGPYV